MKKCYLHYCILEVILFYQDVYLSFKNFYNYSILDLHPQIKFPT